MSEIKAFIVLGATGRQGGAVVDALLTDAEIKILPTQVYAITRQPAGTAADRLRERFRGINIIVGDWGNPNAIFEQLIPETLSQSGVFPAQAHGPTELPDGKAFIDAAVAYGIPYFVYSSVDRGGRELSDADPSYCKTFSDKFYIERHLKMPVVLKRSERITWTIPSFAQLGLLTMPGGDFPASCAWLDGEITWEGRHCKLQSPKTLADGQSRVWSGPTELACETKLSQLQAMT